MAGALVTMNQVCCHLITQKLFEGQHHTKICEAHNFRRCLVFKVKKLLDDGQDLTPWLRDRKKQCVWTDTAITTVQAAVAEGQKEAM